MRTAVALALWLPVAGLAAPPSAPAAGVPHERTRVAASARLEREHLRLEDEQIPLRDEQIRLQDEQIHLEDEHTRLADARLRRESGFFAGLQGWVPAATLLVSALVAVGGLWRYFLQRKRARDVELAQGINENLAQIVNSRLQPDATVKVVAALRGLERLIAAAGAGTQANARREGVTDTLETFARDGLTQLDSPTDARLPVVLLEEWPLFRERVISDKYLRELVLSRYRGTLAAFAAQHPVYANTARMDESGAYVADEDLGETDTALFANAVEGYAAYARLSEDAQARTRSAQELGATLNNQALATALIEG